MEGNAKHPAQASENNTPHKSGFVNIIGNPNVGKSTLMNRLVGERLSIITSKAQTTRHRIMGIVSGPDFQIVYSDTPGVLKPKYKLQESMLNFSTGALSDADVLVYDNLASAAAFCPQNGFAVYAATKAYVLSLSRALSSELRSRGIIVTAVCPGPVDTEFFQVSGELTDPLKKLTMAKAPAVVHKALKDSRKRREVSVYGASMKAARIGACLLPHRLILRAEELL